MGLRGWAVLGLLVGAIGWWYSPVSPRVPDPPRVVAAAASGDGPSSAVANVLCPPPPRTGAGAPPLQSDVPSGFPALAIEEARLTPLAGFSIDARVLGRQDYASGREADFSPTDLALGWGRMRDDAVVSQLQIRQSSRWYNYRWQGQPPIPPGEIAASSANMHFIPSDRATAAALRRIGTSDRVRIDGWLVEVDADDGWRWRSSLSREDTGAGACEVVYVCGIARF